MHFFRVLFKPPLCHKLPRFGKYDRVITVVNWGSADNRLQETGVRIC